MKVRGEGPGSSGGTEGGPMDVTVGLVRFIRRVRNCSRRSPEVGRGWVRDGRTESRQRGRRSRGSKRGVWRNPRRETDLKENEGKGWTDRL